MKQNTNHYRWQLIDFVKGIAIVGVVIYHFFFIVYFLSLAPIHIGDWKLVVLAKLSAGTFIFLSGANVYLATKTFHPKRFVKGLGVLALAALSITLATNTLVSYATVWFGILHFLVMARIVLLPITYYKTGILVSLIYLISLYVFVTFISTMIPSAIWLVFGFPPSGFTSLDYYPIFPWIYLVYLGYIAMQYIEKKEKVKKLDNKLQMYFLPGIALLGKHSLLIYLIHVPIILGLILFFR